MSQVEEHYNNLLAKHYTWMFGTPFTAKVAEQRAILAEVLTAARDISGFGLAIDLGSGPGFQSIALAELGYSLVLAVDTSASLLNELRSHQGDLPVHSGKIIYKGHSSQPQNYR